MIFKVQKQPLDNKSLGKSKRSTAKYPVNLSSTLDRVQRKALSSLTRHWTDKFYVKESGTYRYHDAYRIKDLSILVYGALTFVGRVAQSV